MTEWQPIETLEGSKGHEPIIVCDVLNGGCPFIAFQMPDRGEWRYYFEGVEFDIADNTHWMPLPKPPLAQKE